MLLLQIVIFLHLHTGGHNYTANYSKVCAGVFMVKLDVFSIAYMTYS